MGGFLLSTSALDLKSGQTILLFLLLMIVSFYTGTFFGPSSSIYVSQFSLNSSQGDPTFSNRVTLTYRKLSVKIPETGMNICPIEFNEYIPCHDPLYNKELPPSLDISKREDLERH